MNNKKITIIIPIYNASTYLEECLSSLLTQTYKNIEIILINDGSTDNSLDIIKRFMNKDDRIKLINQSNAGVSAARNIGLENATGRYIIFIDADDYLIDNHAIHKLHLVANKKHDIVIYNILYENKEVSYLLPEKSYIEEKEINNLLFHLIKDEHINSPCNKLYDRQILTEHNIKFDRDIKIGEDLSFNIQYFKYCKSVYYLNDILYFYRTSNNDSATSIFIKSKYTDLISVNNRLIEWVKSRHDDRLVGVSNYIRIKNILSCLRDLNISPDSANNIARAINYKNSNPKIIILNAGIKLCLISLIYTYVDVKILCNIIWRLYPSRANHPMKGKTV